MGGEKRTRRDFAKMAVAAAVGAGAIPLLDRVADAAESVTMAAAAGGPKDAKVCLVRSKVPIPKGKDAKEVFHGMLEEGLREISGGAGSDALMKGLFKADDRVAVKVNNFGFQGHRGPQLAGAICERLQGAGVVPENVVVFDNSEGLLRGARYKINRNGPGFRCTGSDFKGYMEKKFKHGETEVRYSKIIDECTAIVNMPSLKAHTLSGVTICMKNHYGSIEEPKQYHANACDPYIADISTVGIIRDKTRLCVCDATKVLFAGGPEWMEQCIADYDGILVSTDPVALDAVGYSIIKKLRKESGKKQLPWNPEPKQLKTAQRNGIGVSDLERIDFVTLTV